MGLQLSTLNSPTRSQVKPSFDDGQSKATEVTEDSTVVPRSPALGDLSTSIARLPRASHQSWRRGSRSVSDLPTAKSNEKESAPISVAISRGPVLKRTDSDPDQLRGRRSSVPVKCPPRQSRRLPSESDGPLSPHYDGEDASYLMRVYDTRTWEMYRRITESRKNSKYNYAGEQAPPAASSATR